MAATGLNQVFDQSQIADAINRQKIGSQRQRREMMRLGTTDPSAFALQNQQSLQQAQQPSEFLGAGRKPLPPGSDRSLLQAAGLGIQDTSSEGTVYYGDQDPLKFSWGGQDADDINLGGGKYNIMSGGQSVGTGYKSVQDAIRELRLEKSSISPTQFWKGVDSLPDSVYDLPYWANPVGDYYPSQKVLNEQKLAQAGYRRNAAYQAALTNDPETPWMRVSDNRPDSAKNQFEQLINGYSFNGSTYESQAEAEAARQAAANANISGNATKDWEILGQLLNYGTTTGTFNDRAIGGNNIADPISGLNTLFGTRPIMYDGKLHSYYGDLNVNPITDNWANQWSSTSKSGGLFNKKVTTNWGWDQGNLGMGRQLVNPDWYSTNAIVRDGKFTVTPEAAKNAPGWLNADYFNRDQGSGSSTQKQGILASLNEALSYIDPLGHAIEGGVAKLLGYDSGLDMVRSIGEPIGNVAGAIFSGGIPWGSIAMAADNASRGNWKGVGNNAINGLVSYAGSNVGSNGVMGTGTSLGSAAANSAANNMIINAGANYARTGNIGSSLKAAAFSTAAGAAGNWLGSATASNLGEIGSKALGGAASGGLNSLFTKNSPIEGSLFGAMSGGLHGFLNSTDMQNKTFNQQANNRNLNLAKNVTGLAKIMLRNKDGSTKTTR